MTELPLISIAICTYNGAKFLEPLLESIINQSFVNLEIVIVDDCSIDDTLDILNIYQKKDSRIKISLNTHNLGYTKNFEKAITLCAGDYISLCDQDDIWEKDKIEILLHEVKDNILIYHNSDFIDDTGQSIETDTMGARYRMYDGTSCLPFILSNCISGHAVLFSKNLIKYFLPFNKRFYHDWWIAYVAFNIGKVKYVDKVLVHYRQHLNSVTDTLKLSSPENIVISPGRNIKRLALDLNWLEYCANYKYNREPELIKQAYFLLSNLSIGKKKGSTFKFLIKNFDLLFYIRFKPKSYISKLNIIRKIYF